MILEMLNDLSLVPMAYDYDFILKVFRSENFLDFIIKCSDWRIIMMLKINGCYELVEV